MNRKSLTLCLFIGLSASTAWASCDPIADAKSATPAMPVIMEKDVEILTSTGGGDMYLGARVKKGTKLTSPFRTDRVPKGEHVIVRYVDEACGWTKKKVVFMDDIWKSFGQSPGPAKNP